jgi:hypothetical protein
MESYKKDNNGTSRRNFIATTSLAGAGLMIGRFSSANVRKIPVTMDRRKLGTLEVSALGLGA